EGELASCPRFAFHPDLASKSEHQAASDRQSQAHAIRELFGLRQPNKIVKNFLLELRRNARAGVGDAHFDSIGMFHALPAAFTCDARLLRATPLPHVRLGMKPDGSSRGSELRCI